MESSAINDLLVPASFFHYRRRLKAQATYLKRRLNIDIEDAYQLLAHAWGLDSWSDVIQLLDELLFIRRTSCRNPREMVLEDLQIAAYKIEQVDLALCRSTEVEGPENVHDIKKVFEALTKHPTTDDKLVTCSWEFFQLFFSKKASLDYLEKIVTHRTAFLASRHVYSNEFKKEVAGLVLRMIHSHILFRSSVLLKIETTEGCLLELISCAQGMLGMDESSYEVEFDVCDHAGELLISALEPDSCSAQSTIELQRLIKDELVHLNIKELCNQLSLIPSDLLSGSKKDFAILDRVIAHAPDDALVALAYDESGEYIYIKHMIVKNEIDATQVLASASRMRVRKIADDERLTSMDLVVAGVNYENGYYFIPALEGRIV